MNYQKLLVAIRKVPLLLYVRFVPSKHFLINKAVIILLPILLSLLSYSLKAQISDSIFHRLSGYVDAIENFGEVFPQEKVYLHFDNTSYYQGDPIWFQCYVVTSELNHLSDLSKTLYVELLNPGGEIVSKRVLPIKKWALP